MRKQNYSILLPQIDDLQEIKVMLADRLEEWAHGYIAEGKQEGLHEGKLQGLQQGEMLALQRLLAKRFGVIPMETVSLISQAPLEDIERWFDRAIDATKLSDVFTD
jgi:flagellar biosynthesis/type III secretory pathway protein FliH